MNKVALMVVLLAYGCGSEAPANVAGLYTLSLNIQETGCGILNNPVGTTASGVAVRFTQTGSEVQAEVQGLGGVVLGVGLGSSTFVGTVSGNSLDMSIPGRTPGASGTCAYTMNAHLVGKASGDMISGSITYTYVTNKTADCGTRNTCQDVQLYSGTRPPTIKP